ncbi:MAG: polyribonucleotide nucleotidyltransferase [bacterium]
MEKTEIRFGSKDFIIETGEVARQADGSVIIRYGESVVFAAAVSQKTAREGLDFFPLTIDYQEKAYSAGKIPGGYFKREGRPTEKEVLTSRLIDRPMRPLFPNDYKFETQGVVSVLSHGDENVSDILGITAMSTAFTISDIPFNGPVAGVRVGRLNGEYILNPNSEEMEKSDLNFIVAGTEHAVVMVEGGANEMPEDVVIGAIDFAHDNIRKLVSLQKEFARKIGNPKRTYSVPEKEDSLHEKIRETFQGELAKVIFVPGKHERQGSIDQLLQRALEMFDTPEGDHAKEIEESFEDLEKELVRGSILNNGIRADGRKPEDIRHIHSRIGFLPRVHGSALFTRGETQALVVTTLGTGEDEQRIETLDGESYKTFMLHYNFPPFSVGEVKPLRSPGRREIGHGALAERAIRYVLPPKEQFPYTIRIVSDVMESNGSSSMASVCGSSLSLMDAGVPIKAPVAGIAMGLIQENERSIVLSDILGLEDHLGDMDFKVTGTAKGITAFQMDVKIEGIPRSIMEKALSQAKEGRLHILRIMSETISEPRKELSRNAPRIFTMQVKTDKIRDIIGTGGKVIRGIIEETGVKIDIDDSGLVNIASSDEASAQKAIEIIKGIIAEPEVGKIYLGKVKKVVDFGAFVEILPGIEGLLHISQISHKRINKVTDEIREGDEVLVKVIEVDRSGKMKLSRKEAMNKEKEPAL